MLWFFIILIHPCLQAEPTPASMPALLVDHRDENSLLGLIHDLGSPSYRAREQATNALMEWDTTAYPALKEAFDRDDHFEVRRRIKQAVFEIYLSDQVGPARAFLGISQAGPAGGLEELRIPPGASALRITDVFTGLAADVAGVQRGDLIFTVEGQRGRPDAQGSQLTEQIGRKKPGDVIRLGVFRGGVGLILQDGETPGFRIKDLAGCKKRLIHHEDDPRVLPGAAAFLIEEIGTRKSDSILKAGDLIVALDSDPVSPTKADDQFQQWISARTNPGAAQIQQLQIQPGRPIRVQGLGTVQILRGGQWLELSARLGRWPSYLSEWLIRSRNIDSTTAAAVQGAFDDWWRTHFDPRGMFSERADNDPRWKLSPAGSGD
jgi:hypothetical protein